MISFLREVRRFKLFRLRVIKNFVNFVLLIKFFSKVENKDRLNF